MHASPRPDPPYDLLVVGGGINGAGIARDARGRGMRVLLVEQGDLAGATSSASTKLIHGGLRYLEYYDFKLVREALRERERLIRIAPHIIWPLRFVLPHEDAMRPAWLVRLGLFLYDHIGGRRSLPGSSSVRFSRSAYGAPLKPRVKRGFIYSDAWVEDARLVALNARGAAEQGCEIRTRTRLVSAHRQDRLWRAELERTQDGHRSAVLARALVNASGSWVSELLHERLSVRNDKGVRLVKGSYIVVPRLYEGGQAYILQNPDRRIVFAIPYEHRFTLIGTTDVPVAARSQPTASSRNTRSKSWCRRSRTLRPPGHAPGPSASRCPVATCTMPASTRFLSICAGVRRSWVRIWHSGLDGPMAPGFTKSSPAPARLMISASVSEAP